MLALDGGERVRETVPVSDILQPSVQDTDILSGRGTGRWRPPLWILAAACAATWTALYLYTLLNQPVGVLWSSPWRPAAAFVLHLPYMATLVLIGLGLIERIGYFRKGRASVPPGSLPRRLPSVCVQLPMFNESAVAARVVEAAAALDWPADRLSIQVLDDSTDPDTKKAVEAICDRVERRTGVRCAFLHRTDRAGYKAGALEIGRRLTDAEYIAIFDADFVPDPTYLRRTVPHFYDAGGSPRRDLALVQAQWGHLNDDENLLTGAQALWVDDHHTLQQSWRSATLGFVNFTGTAGVWRASAIEAAGGWRSASLVEDCELSFRVLFAGYRTRFVRDVVVPAELPQTLAAYRSQQKRWTQGWAQLQRLHLRRLLFEFRAGPFRKAQLLHLMCISWQWPVWAMWIVVFPFLIANGLSLAELDPGAALLAYAVPPLAFAVFAGLVATVETRSTYMDGAGRIRTSTRRRLARLIPYLVINAGMLPHHICAFAEGLFGPLHSEFERTPKTASVTAPPPGARLTSSSGLLRRAKRRPARPAYIAVEVALVLMQLAWVSLFVARGMLVAAAGAAWLVLCVAVLRVAPHFRRPRSRAPLRPSRA
jgi:cellulose synthase/poly-beta-1,6-N-acetylglucosamine synthase-like glycosyltransferase